MIPFGKPDYHEIHTKQYDRVRQLLGDYVHDIYFVLEVISEYGENRQGNIESALGTLKEIASCTWQAIAHLVDVDETTGTRIMANLWLRGHGVVRLLLQGSVAPEYLMSLTADPIPIIERMYGLDPSPAGYID